MSRLRRTPLLLALVLLLLTPGCRRGPGEAAPRSPRSPVVLVSVDTLRADHLPLYGYRGLETPALTALGADSILFETAYAPAPLTLPSHVSLMTGAAAGVHGVLDNSGYSLAAAVPTLAEVMKANGFETGGAVSSVVLEGRSGISRGFDLWDAAFEEPLPGQPMTQLQRAGSETTAVLSRWIGSRGGKPFLAFLHLFEPHSPYSPPEPFRSRWRDPYDGEIAAADAAVGELVATLKGLGLYEKSLIVFLSDHGEGLGDHGEKEHGIFLYRESIRVPLLLKLPGRRLAGTTVTKPAGLTDVFQTICEVVELEGCPARSGAVSLVELARGADLSPRRILSETFFPRTRFGWSPLASLADERWQYIEAPRPELYDLAADPKEVRNRAPEKPEPIRSMRAELLARRSAFRGPSPVGDEEARKLASLGYVTVATAQGDGALPDPKDVLDTLEPLRDGMVALRSGRPADAVDLLGPLLSASPNLRDGWEIYAQALLALGRDEEALAAAERMVPLSPPRSTDVLLAVATVALQAGRADAALRNASVARDLGDPGAEELLARAYLSSGKLEEAEAAAKRSLAGGRSRGRSLLVLARVATLRGDLSGALALADEAGALFRGREASAPSGYHFVRGDVLARLGRLEEAERELAEETKRFPGRADAHAALVALHAAAGRREEALAAARALVASVPGPGGPAAAIRSLDAIGESAAARELRRQARARFPRDRRFRGGGA